MKYALLLALGLTLLPAISLPQTNCSCAVLAPQKYTCQAGTCKMTIHVAYCGSQFTNCFVCNGNSDFVPCCNEYVVTASNEGYPCSEGPARGRFAIIGSHGTQLVAETCSGAFAALVLGEGGSPNTASSSKDGKFRMSRAQQSSRNDRGHSTRN